VCVCSYEQLTVSIDLFYMFVELKLNTHISIFNLNTNRKTKLTGLP
jgi:hypothetical protein